MDDPARMGSNDGENGLYRVVVNAEDQYSIWEIGKAIPDGWTQVGQAASKEMCLAEIRRLWTDMRPRSLREEMTRSQ